MIKKTIAGLSLIVLILLQSCKTSFELEDVNPNIMDSWSTNMPIDSLPVSQKLLELFNDSSLKNLVEEGLENNLNLKATALRLQASHLMLVETRAARWPSAGLGFEKGRNNQGFNEWGNRKTVDSHHLFLNLSWEIDLWGKLADYHQANKYSYEMQYHDFSSLKDGLAARIIQSWIQLTASINKLQISEEIYQSTLFSNQSISQKYISGLVTLDVFNQSKAELQIATVNLESAREQITRDQRTLEVLLGRQPQTKISPVITFPVLKDPPVTIPAIALANRPDVQSALARAHAAVRLSSAAKKEKLPSVSLSANMFKNHASIGDLTGSTFLWNIIGNLSQPLFHSGKLKKQALAKNKEAEAAIADLQQVVLQALLEVEETMSLERELNATEKALEQAAINFEIIRKYHEEKYKDGLIPFYVLLDSRKNAHQSRMQLNELKANRINNRINLALALGYGLDTKENEEKTENN